jgi:hypothetical protein
LDVDVLFILIGLAWIVFLVVALQWGRTTNRGVSLVAWLGLTFVAWCVEALVAFFAVYGTYFVLGRPAAIVAAIATVVVMALTPLAVAYGLRYWTKYRAART